MDLGLKDKVVVITGAGRGIGAEAALAFAREGAKVAVWDKDLDKAQEVAAQLQRTDAAAIALGGSVGVRQHVEAAVATVLKKFRTIHVLVNNAGFGDDAPLTEMTDEQWDSVLNVCLTGPFYCARAVAPTMIAQRYGRIINVSSRVHLGEINKANYCAATPIAD